MALAADDVADMVVLQRKLPALTLLTDLGLAASVTWGLVPAGSEGAAAATFIIDRGGVIRYRKLGDAKGDWPPYADVAAALR